MTSFRVGLLAILAVIGIALALLTTKGSEDRARETASSISARCGVTVRPARDAVSNQFGLAIDPVARACPGEGSSAGVACARKRISESHFAEVAVPPPATCPRKEASL